MPRWTQTIEQRFWAKVEKTDGCWLWKGSQSNTTQHNLHYGLLLVSGKQRLAHRVSWEIATGSQLTRHQCVCHHCDTPLCVRPSHLFMGTQADNIRDMFCKGRDRHPRGVDNTAARLTEQDVRDIRRSALGSLRLAKQFHVGKTTIAHIKRRESWAWLTD